MVWTGLPRADLTERLPLLQGRAQGDLVGLDVAPEHGRRLLPPAELVPVLERGRLRLAGELPPERMPRAAADVRDLRSLLRLVPPSQERLPVERLGRILRGGEDPRVADRVLRNARP